jgi:hypothetical protein
MQGLRKAQQSVSSRIWRAQLHIFCERKVACHGALGYQQNLVAVFASK